MSNPMDQFIREVSAIVREGGPEEVVTTKVAESLRKIIKLPNLLRPEWKKLKDGGFVLWPVHIEEDGSFSIGIAAYGPGEISPIHDHGSSWGVIGVYEGVEHEERFMHDGNVPLDRLATLTNYHEWDKKEGEVFVCCTTDKDVHRVRCGSDKEVYGVHVYGADIGSIERRRYDEETGAATNFVSGWG